MSPAGPVIRIPRRLAWAIRSRCDEETAQQLFTMMWHMQRERSYGRRGFLALVPLPLLVMLTLAAPAPGYWAMSGVLLLAGVCIAAARFRQAQRHGRARRAIWDRDPSRWQEVADALTPVERECLGSETDEEVTVRP